MTDLLGLDADLLEHDALGLRRATGRRVAVLSSELTLRRLSGRPR